MVVGGTSRTAATRPAAPTIKNGSRRTLISASCFVSSLACDNIAILPIYLPTYIHSLVCPVACHACVITSTSHGLHICTLYSISKACHGLTAWLLSLSRVSLAKCRQNYFYPKTRAKTTIFPPGARRRTMAKSLN